MGGEALLYNQLKYAMLSPRDGLPEHDGKVDCLYKYRFSIRNKVKESESAK